MMDQGELAGALDITRVLAGFSFSYLDGMRRKIGEKGAGKSLQLHRVNQSEKYRARFVKFLRSQSLGGLCEFAQAQASTSAG
jgi:hypothetical protein